ncbi:two-component sensor histidine kinase [Arthrobacter sp. BL-252-APC-1A]|uniref:sensor histidine kinase n=1 Tax=Arthrobacter sp. BL-252-APC-1A TaxID=2606622 RepID=UPI0012B1C6AC|nr:histidine kinase [Arthrobacter sp. BL-252-APC-1A]MSR97786.1 two-component sensor histidine kinase [Arthrobacter sp. BL-252-APC-1A]
MRSLLTAARRWAAPSAAAVFFSGWCVVEVGRMSPMAATLPMFWNGTIPLLVLTAAIGVAVRWPVLSLSLTALLLTAQLLKVVQPLDTNWAIYLGAFLSLGLIAWTSKRRTRIIAFAANTVFAAVMTFLMLSWRYGYGVGWLPPLYLGDRAALTAFGPQLFFMLLLIAAACFALGLLLALVQERGRLFRARELAQSTLKDREIDLVVEQERTRISRDLHDVLAHSLAVIAAQADGARYSAKDQPEPVLKALEAISSSARSALVDAQRVIEGVQDDGMSAPQPQMDDIAGLIEGMRSSLDIQEGISGEPVKLSSGQQLAVFRIVQECLTNALKHGGRRTTVRLNFDWSGPGLTLHASSARHPNATEGTAGQRTGRGIPGMRERASLAGGWLTAGPDGDQFRVTLFLPYGPAEGRPAAADPAAGQEPGETPQLALSSGGKVPGDV